LGQLAFRALLLVLLEEPEQLLAEEPTTRAFGTGLPDHRNRRVAVTIEAGVALGLAQGPEPRHGPNVASGPDGPARFFRMAEPRAREFEYEVAYDGTAVATAEGTTVRVPARWS